jgi:DNA-binding SARP family transcriptional activator
MAVNPILSIRLLGGLQIANGQEPATNLERARLQDLLAYLLLHHGRPIPRQQLAFFFWPDSTEKQALTNRRNLWSGLRRALPAADRCLAADEMAVQRRADAPCRLDVAVFENHSAQVQTAVDDNERLHYLEQVDLSRQGAYCLTVIPQYIVPKLTEKTSMDRCAL